MSAASQTPTPPRMTVDEFLAWTFERHDDARFELVHGEVVAMAPETAGHAALKFRIARRLAEAAEASGLGCETFVDGPGVRSANDTLYIPDVILHCGDPVPADRREVDSPLVVVEVVSASTRRVDERMTTIAYFDIPSIRHYLLVYADLRRIMHHERGEDGAIVIHVRTDAPFRLDPPGLDLVGIFGAPLTPAAAQAFG